MKSETEWETCQRENKAWEVYLDGKERGRELDRLDRAIRQASVRQILNVSESLVFEKVWFNQLRLRFESESGRTLNLDSLHMQANPDRPWQQILIDFIKGEI